MLVVDANVLLHATNASSSEHRVAVRWLNSAFGGAEPVGLPWIALLAFLRLSTRPVVFPSPLPIRDALDVTEAWVSHPNAVVVSPTARHFDVLRGLLEASGTAGNLTTDAHLAALTIEYGGTLVSFDRDFQRFAGLRTLVPS